MNVVGHDAPGHKPVMLPVPEAQRRGHSPRDPLICQGTTTKPPIEVLLQTARAVLSQLCLLRWKQSGPSRFGSLQDSMAFGHLFENGQGKRVRHTERDEVEARLFLPVRQAATVANMYLAKARLRSAVELRGVLG